MYSEYRTVPCGIPASSRLGRSSLFLYVDTCSYNGDKKENEKEKEEIKYIRIGTWNTKTMNEKE